MLYTLFLYRFTYLLGHPNLLSTAASIQRPIFFLYFCFPQKIYLAMESGLGCREIAWHMFKEHWWMPVISTLAIFDRFHKKICRAISRPKRQGIFNGKYLQSWTKVSDFCPNPMRTSKSKKGIHILGYNRDTPRKFWVPTDYHFYSGGYFTKIPSRYTLRAFLLLKNSYH